MHAVVAISPGGAEMVASVHDSHDEAKRELERQVERRGSVWTFVIRRVVEDEE